jgi:Flp pilus assembly protein TadG
MRPHFIFCQHGVHGRARDFDFILARFIKQAIAGCAAVAPAGADAPALMHPTVSTSRAQHTFILHATAVEAASATEARKRHTRRILPVAPEVNDNEGLRALAVLPPIALPPTAWLFHSTRLQGLSSDCGVRECGARIVPDLVQCMTAFADAWDAYNADTAATSAAKRPAFSVVCHSFGGVLTREVAYLLQRDHRALLARFDVESWIAIASPLCGVTELPWWMHVGAKAIGRCYSRTYQELLLDEGVDDVAATTLGGYMVDDVHLEAMRMFRHRILVPNTIGDALVAFKTSALVTDHADDANLLVSAAAATRTTPDTQPAAAAAAAATAAVATSAAAGVTIAQGGEEVMVGAPILLPQLAASTDSGASKASHFERGWTTRHHELATSIARCLREAMDWEVWPVYPGHSTIAARLHRVHDTVIGNTFVFRPLHGVVDTIVAKLLARDEAE